MLVQAPAYGRDRLGVFKKAQVKDVPGSGCRTSIGEVWGKQHEAARANGRTFVG